VPGGLKSRPQMGGGDLNWNSHTGILVSSHERPTKELQRNRLRSKTFITSALFSGMWRPEVR
jgi:hypothetical protein